jgi:hypothetical protein
MLMRAIAVCCGLFLAMPAQAQSTDPVPDKPAPATVPSPQAGPPPSSVTPGEGDDSRYSFNRVQDGYLRLDVRTGQVALCSRRQVGWACQVLPDDRNVLEGEIARLQTENGTLKKELLSRGIALPTGVKAPPPEPKADESKAPGANLDRLMGLIETTWRRLVEMIGVLQRDILKRT